MKTDWYGTAQKEMKKEMTRSADFWLCFFIPPWYIISRTFSAKMKWGMGGGRKGGDRPTVQTSIGWSSKKSDQSRAPSLSLSCSAGEFWWNLGLSNPPPLPPAPPSEQTNGPSKAQRVRHSSRTNTAILRRRLAYKLQIVSWAQIEFQSDICRAVLMQAASTWLSRWLHLTLCRRPELLVYCLLLIRNISWYVWLPLGTSGYLLVPLGYLLVPLVTSWLPLGTSGYL